VQLRSGGRNPLDPDSGTQLRAPARGASLEAVRYACRVQLALIAPTPASGGWRNAGIESMNELPHLREVESAGLRKLQHADAMDDFR